MATQFTVLWIVLCSIFNNLSPVYAIEHCEGHYGPRGEESTLYDTDLEWCCNNCDCTDLGDRLPTYECYTYCSDESWCCKTCDCMNSSYALSEAECFGVTYCEGHYEPGKDTTLIDTDMKWCCRACDCTDLRDQLPDNECNSSLLYTSAIYTTNALVDDDDNETKQSKDTAEVIGIICAVVTGIFCVGFIVYMLKREKKEENDVTEEDDNDPEGVTSGDTNSDNLCIICCDRAANMFNDPCGHVSYCKNCSVTALRQDNKCPQCRQKIQCKQIFNAGFTQ